jgi:sulfatase modifying factor 1
MKHALAIAVALALLCLGSLVQANVIDPAVNIETVTVVNAGNAGNALYYGTFGSVGYNYNIGKYEVTTAQYVNFLNHKAQSDPYGLYNTNMDTANNQYGCNIIRTGSSGSYSYSVAGDWANRPVNFVSYWDSCRFANWLNNGQGNGSTETGIYALGGYNGNFGSTIQRNVGVGGWAVTSVDEWYKAAYYDPNKPGGAGYWLYPTKSDTMPGNQVLGIDPGNSANYSNVFNNTSTIGSPYYRTNVGEFENSAGAYGTFDMAGNVYEWNEAVVYQDGTADWHSILGGSFDGNKWSLQNDNPGEAAPSQESGSFGFRLSQVAPVPEPSSILVVLCGLGGIIWRRRR